MDEWYHGLSRQGVDTLKEGQMSGALSTRIAQLISLAQDENSQGNAPISVDPGDFIFVGGENPGLSLTLPIAYDVWYIWQTVNIMPQVKEDAEQFTALILDPIFKQYGKIYPLRTISKATSKGSKDIEPNLIYFQNQGIECIKEMRFETFLYDKAPNFVSNGPQYSNHPEINHSEKGIADLYCGFLAFPVGPLGVEQVLSVVSVSLLNKDEYKVQDDSLKPQENENLLTQIGAQTNVCMGRHLIESAYLMVDRDVEYPASKMDGQESILPHHWMRLWLDREGEWPIPGEFIAMIAKPMGNPPHCWWYQRTSPFVYSGNFFETEYYTSGIVLAVIENVDYNQDTKKSKYEVASISSIYSQKTGDGNFILSVGMIYEDMDHSGSIYKVRVKDQDLYLKSSDFLDYTIDQLVTVRKAPGVKDNFTWNDLSAGRLVCGYGVEAKIEYDNKMSGEDFKISEEWVIVPITFYKE